MSTLIFVNLPVKDLERSKKFYTGLGYQLNPQFTDDKAACVVISETIYVMVLLEEFFKTFTPKPVGDARQATQTIVSLTAESRECVDKMIELAVAAGGRIYRETMDRGWMYERGFEDPDGHLWEVFYMDMEAAQKAMAGG